MKFKEGDKVKVKDSGKIYTIDQSYRDRFPGDGSYKNEDKWYTVKEVLMGYKVDNLELVSEQVVTRPVKKLTVAEEWGFEND